MSKPRAAHVSAGIGVLFLLVIIGAFLRISIRQGDQGAELKAAVATINADRAKNHSDLQAQIVKEHADQCATIATEIRRSVSYLHGVEAAINCPLTKLLPPFPTATTTVTVKPGTATTPETRASGPDEPDLNALEQPVSPTPTATPPLVPPQVAPAEPSPSPAPVLCILTVCLGGTL